jgi:hypothetical protein
MVRRQAGSILVEVLLTVVIMSISLTILTGSLLSGYRLTVLNSDYFQALVFLENKMGHAYYDGFKNLSSEEFTADHGKVFSLDLQTAPIEKSGGSLKAINAVLSWPSGKRTIKLPVSTYFIEVPEQPVKRGDIVP